ncbi:MAG: SdpI family protein [Dictyoglomaceae bacterium]
MREKYKVDRGTFKRDLLVILLILLMFVSGIIVYPFLPEKVPAHWNIKGEVDRYESRFWGAFGIPLLVLAIYLGLLYLPYIDPKRENYLKFEGVYRIIRHTFVIIFSLIHFTILYIALGGPKNLVPKIIPAVLGILFIILGNYMPKIKYNWFIGIRTPWTLSNEEVWRKTHRFSGFAFVIAGIFLLISGFLPPYLNFLLGIGGILIAVILSILYSFLVYKKLANNK